MEQVQSSPTFRRYRVSRGGEAEILDLVRDFCPQVDEKKNRWGQIVVDTIHEIFLNKICTLVSRCELKDVIDLYFLDKHGFSVEKHFNEARRKDAGLEPAIVSMLLAQVKTDRMPEYLASEMSKEELCRFIDRLRLEMAEMAYPEKN